MGRKRDQGGEGSRHRGIEGEEAATAVLDDKDLSGGFEKADVVTLDGELLDGEACRERLKEICATVAEIAHAEELATACQQQVKLAKESLEDAQGHVRELEAKLRDQVRGQKLLF